MNENGFFMNRRQLLEILMGGILPLFFYHNLDAQERKKSEAGPLSDVQTKYLGTITVLQMAYRNEIQAHLNYFAYAQKAVLENYPNIAYLFNSFSVSESIHARNFERVLSGLGVEGKETPKPEVKVFDTKTNLKKAIEFELKDINQNYPQFVERAKPENYEPAVRNLVHSWETEKQHRDLLQKMEKGTGVFFGLLSKRIEETSVIYFVCHGCGSTAIELPKDSCLICKAPASQSNEIKRTQ